MSAQHTPAPWTAERDPSHFDTLSNVTGGSQLKKVGWKAELMVSVGGYADVATQEANTRLIAAAPELLSAAKAVVERWVSTDWKDAEPTANLIYALNAVIEKATHNGI